MKRLVLFLLALSAWVPEAHAWFTSYATMLPPAMTLPFFD